jgi:GNAT superfamily N-acetyltransferase
MSALSETRVDPAGRAIAIRKAVAGDIPIILRFIRELATYEKLLDEVEANEDRLTRTLFPAGGGPPVAHVLIGELDGRPQGFAVYFFNYSTFLAKEGIYLEDLFVMPDCRGNGLGRALLLYLAALAVSRGCGRMDWSVLDWNSPSIEFYRGLGAVPLGDWTTFRLTAAALDKFGRQGNPT